MIRDNGSEAPGTLGAGSAGDQRTVAAGNVVFGNDLPLVLIAGPCQLETRDHALRLAGVLAEACAAAGIIFVGPPGLGYFGEIERVGQFQIVAAVWVFQLIFSTIWLSRFRFGPMEWVWRSLTYWKPQPMRKSVAGDPPPTPA